MKEAGRVDWGGTPRRRSGGGRIGEETRRGVEEGKAVVGARWGGGEALGAAGEGGRRGRNDSERKKQPSCIIQD